MSSGADRSRVRVAVLGAGVVGSRATRELVASQPAVGVALHCSRKERRNALTETFGSDVVVLSDTDDVDPSVEVVVLAGDQQSQVELAALHVGAGRHVVATADRSDVVGSLLELDQAAMTAERTVVVGAAFSPGLTCLLSRHAVTTLDTVEEMHFARHGAAGPMCAADRMTALRRPVREWRDDTWETRSPGSGRELCWFPDPVGGADAYRAATGEPQLAVDAFPRLHRSSARMVLSRRDRLTQHLPSLWPAPAEGGVGAVRVEVRGSVDGVRRTIVLGALDRPGVAAAAVIAEVVIVALAGRAPLGAHGLSTWSEAGELLARLRLRGVRVATLAGEHHTV